ncbi:hypothetical protein QF035_000024 [Streptomyces umbrinus]|uniref:Uncharacterized protein n=2 Tax=Streptomyces umbrinus TaxID=67370 RepID=A0ABU0SFV0_9ACTN|nr:hypothetical protein [Streptomyces umbrinus]
MSGMTGRVYLERGRPVTVVTPYCARRAPELTGDWLHFQWPGRRPAAGPRNVAIRRADGSTTVRPFRGLTRPPSHPNASEENSR